VYEFSVSEWQGLAVGSAFPSMVLPGYAGGRSVTPSIEGTSVLRSRNVRPIGQRDRWWQNCSGEHTVSSRYACATQAHGCS